jgi:hypothetical protein
MLRLGRCGGCIAVSSVTQMKTQQPPDLPIEVHFASLDTGREQCALAHFKHPSCHAQTIGMDKPADNNAIADFNFFHDFTLWKICHSAIFDYALAPLALQGNCVSPLFISPRLMYKYPGA